jgi:thioredoxin 1
MIMAKITEVGDNNFETEVIQSNLPVLVDFWAPWCGPCKSIAPIVEELAGQYEGKLKIAKLNVDDHPATASRYGIRGIPNLIILKGGAVKEQIVGAVPKARLVAAIEKALQLQ